MSTRSRDEGGHNGFAEDSSEPLGLSATAFGRSPDPRPQTPIPPEHQQAVELVSRARRYLREGRLDDAKDLFRQAADLERQVLRSIASQPEKSLISEFAARAALQAGRFDLARDLVRRGLTPRAPETMQWSLLLASIQAELIEFLEEFERGWQVPWDPVDEEESLILVVSRSGRRLVFNVDPDAASVFPKLSSPDELTFVIPAVRPNGAALSTLEKFVTPWLRPRRLAQPVLDRRGVMETFLMDPVFP